MSQENEVMEAPEKVNHLEEFVGYYEWEGLPCRVRKDEFRPHVLHAEMYVPGEGYVAASFTDIVLQAHPVNEKLYREMLVRISLKKQKSH